VDADPTETLAKRYNPDGPLGAVPVLAEPEERVGDAIAELRQRHSPVIVDTAGFRNRATISALVAMGRGDAIDPPLGAMTAPIALVDCNNFYASCELVFQSALRGRPGVVLSNNDGCVIARSNEAKALGVAMGEAWHICKKRVDTQGVIVRSSNYTL
jgi:hypothetical protein